MGATAASPSIAPRRMITTKRGSRAPAALAGQGAIAAAKETQTLWSAARREISREPAVMLISSGIPAT